MITKASDYFYGVVNVLATLMIAFVFYGLVIIDPLTTNVLLIASAFCLGYTTKVFQSCCRKRCTRRGD